jgi:hypothetical protein
MAAVGATTTSVGVITGKAVGAIAVGVGTMVVVGTTLAGIMAGVETTGLITKDLEMVLEITADLIITDLETMVVMAQEVLLIQEAIQVAMRL